MCDWTIQLDEFSKGRSLRQQVAEEYLPIHEREPQDKNFLPLARKLRSDPTVCDGVARDLAHARLSLFVYLRSSVKRIISDDLLLLYIYDSVLS